MVNRTRQRGLTLIELMVAATIGLIISGAVVSVYVNSVRSLNQDDRYARMQENGRFALRVLTEDLVMADFWGQVISTDTLSTTLAPPLGDCAEDIDVFDATTGVLFNNYHELVPVTQFAPCATITGTREPQTDVLVLKRVQGAPTARTFTDINDTDGDGDTTEVLTTGAASLQAGTVYLRGNGTTGAFIDDAAPANPPVLGESDWQYLPRVYFVRSYYENPGDGVPALCRLDSNGAGLGAPACIAEGIEDLHLEFGIDDSGDGVADRYTATPTLAEMETAAAARVYVLARTTEADPIYTNAKTYNLGDVVVPPANDGFYRSVFSTTVSLRNTVSRNLLN